MGLNSTNVCFPVTSINSRLDEKFDKPGKVKILMAAIRHPITSYNEYNRKKMEEQKNEGIKDILEYLSFGSRDLDEEGVVKWVDLRKPLNDKLYSYYLGERRELPPEEEEQIKVILKEKILIIWDEIFQNPKKYITIYGGISQNLILEKNCLHKFIETTFDDSNIFRLEIDSDKKRDILYWTYCEIRRAFQRVLEKYYAPGTNNYRNMKKKLK